MAIEILVKPEIDEASLDKSAAELEATFKAASARTGRQIQDNLSDALTKASVTAVNAAGQVSTAEAKLTDVRQKAETQAKAVAKAEESLTRLRQTPLLTEAIAAAESRLAAERDKHTGILARLTAAEEAAAKARRTESLAVRSVSNAFKDATTTASGLTDAFGSLTSIASAVSPMMAGIGASILPLAGIATAASGALGLLPGALLGAGAAVGTFKLATGGVGDALGDIGDPKKFATDLQGLAPAAQQFALSVEAIMPQLQGLKAATQNSFFAGMGPQIQQLATVYLPSLKTALTGISDAFNRAFSGAAHELMSPETSSAIRSTLSNITSGAHDLSGALGPVVHAFGQIAEVSSGFLPQLAQAAGNAANAFQGFIQNASRTGELKHWIQDGIDTMKVLGSATVTVGQAIAELEPIGMKALPAITSAANDFKSAMDGIKTATDGVSSAITTVENAFTSLGRIADPILNGIQDALWAITNPANAIAQIFGQGVDPQSITNPRQYSGGGGTFDGSAADKWLAADQAAHPNRATGGTGAFRRRDGSVGTIPNSAPTTNYAVPAVPDATTKTSGADKTPAGTKTDPLYTAPSTSLATGTQPSSASNPWDSYDPLQQAASGGFSLPNIARMGTTFLAELALGNPLGKLQAQKLGSSASNPLYTLDVSRQGGQQQGMPQPNAGDPAVAFAQDANGAPYVYGAVGPNGWDCSGFMSDIFSKEVGLPTGTRRFTTTSDFQSLGFQPGYDPYSPFNIGVNPKPGKSGHMAGTLDGVNVEAGGAADRVQYGGNAAGALDPQFSQRYHLPIAYGGGGGLGAGIAQPSLGQMSTGWGSGPGTAKAGASLLSGAGATPHLGTGAPPGPGNSSAGQAQAATPGTGKGAGVSGGILGTAEAAAATALNGIAPGAGAAAQIATEEANRFAGYLGQLGGIAASGILETFSLHGSDMTSSGGLPGKILGGLAGAHPVTPNSAATTQPAQKPNDKGDQSNSKNNGGQNGPLVQNNIENQHFHNTDSGQVASEQNRQLMAATAANPI